MQKVQPDSLWPGSLNRFDITLPTLEENLALDEALLSAVDTEPQFACLRFWQPADYSVVLGRSNRSETEVAIDDCQAQGIGVFRRASGGGAVLIGPGCLCYSLVLPISELHRSLGVARVTKELMGRTANGLRLFCPEIQVSGTSDLALSDLKFSGNAQRWLRHAFIHHGTVLYSFDVSCVERTLRHPTREPDYRNSRRHREFITNLPIDPLVLRSCMSESWNAIPTDVPAAVVETASRVAASRYSSADWKIVPSR